MTKGAWADAVQLPGLGSDLLQGMAVRGAPAFETWLLSQQRHLAAASEAILHEAALGSLCFGDLAAATGYAARAAAMSPLDENHQALLIRLYRLAGDDDSAAQRQYDLCVRDLSRTSSACAPGRRSRPPSASPVRRPHEESDDATIEAIVEAGARCGVGGCGRGRTPVAALGQPPGSTAARSDALRVRVRLVLAEALIHSVRGLDEEGLADLFEAEGIALRHGLTELVAQARAELGYVDFLRGQVRARRAAG